MFGVEVPVAGGQPPAAVGDDADAAPGPVGDFEDVLQHGEGGRVALRADGPRVGVVDGVLAAFQLPHGPAYAFQDVQRLESRHHDRHAVAGGQLGVLSHAHHAAHMPGGEEALDPAAR